MLERGAADEAKHDHTLRLDDDAGRPYVDAVRGVHHEAGSVVDERRGHAGALRRLATSQRPAECWAGHDVGSTPALRLCHMLGQFRPMRPLGMIIIICVATHSQRPYTDLSAARVREPGNMHSLQPCQLGNDPLQILVLYPLWKVHGGASLCKPLGISGGVG